MLKVDIAKFMLNLLTSHCGGDGVSLAGPMSSFFIFLWFSFFAGYYHHHRLERLCLLLGIHLLTHRTQRVPFLLLSVCSIFTALS